MRRVWRYHRVNLLAILGLAILATLVGVYVLAHQRVRFPLFEERAYTIKAVFSTAQAVTPGQGQTVRVSGVRIGDISDVGLRDGNAVVTMALDPEYGDLIHTDATAVLRPKTGLKDMFVELTPGSSRAPVAKRGFTLPVANTRPDVNVDEILAMLDSDTRDYLRILVQGLGQGLKHRSNALAEIYRRFEPTHRDLARVTHSVAARRADLRQVVHALRLLSTEVAGKDRELAELVASSAEVFKAFASEDRRVSESLELLPGALRQTSSTLRRVESFATALRPAATHLLPAVRRLPRASAALEPLAREATPVVKGSLRPFARQARPVVSTLRPAADQLSHSAKWLTQSGTVLNDLLDMAGYNEAGRQGPEVKGRVPGYLYWLAWLNHDAIALFSTGDAHGDFRPLVENAPCASLQGLAQALGQGDPLVGVALHGLQGVFTDPRVCGSTQQQNPAFARRLRGKPSR